MPLIEDGTSNTFLAGEKHVPAGMFGRLKVGDGPIYSGAWSAFPGRIAGIEDPLARGPNDITPQRRHRGRHLCPQVRQLASRHLPVRLLRRQRPDGPRHHRRRPTCAGWRSATTAKSSPPTDRAETTSPTSDALEDREQHDRLRLAANLLPPACRSAAAGCGGGGVYPVEGQVVWKDGTPAKELAGSLIFFELAEKQTSARGQHQADGSFQLTTEKRDDGALAGEHTVTIIEVGRKSLGGPDTSAIAPGKIDTRYSTPSTSDLRASVKPGTNKITLDRRSLGRSAAFAIAASAAPGSGFLLHALAPKSTPTNRPPIRANIPPSVAWAAIRRFGELG